MLGTTNESVVCPNRLGVGISLPTVALDVVGALKVSNYISVTNAVGCGDFNSSN